MDAKEEVRARLNIEEVIGEYVPLKRAGRSWKGLSPFGQEKTPSFFVSPDKGIWHDFSSNRGGDVFSFVMEVEGIEFREALELLARKAGVELSLYDGDKAKDTAARKNQLLKLLDVAATFYQRQLIAAPAAIEYINKKRGFTRQTVLDFRLGYAPADGTVLRDFLIGKGYAQADIDDAGLSAQRRSGKVDMFRDRIMVPLMDPTGRVIGFTARLLGDVPNAPKYINTPQTLLYDKSRHVYGLHLAKEAVRKADTGVIVEGNMDVIASHQAGVKQVVATAGTAITASHLKALSRLSPRVRLAFDGDKAGIAATERAIPIAQSVGVELGIVSMPDDAKDPDELIQKDPALWQSAIDDAVPAIEWVMRMVAAGQDLSTASGKQALVNRTMQVLKSVQDPVEREHYLATLASMLGITLATLQDRLQMETPDDAPMKQVRAPAQASSRDSRPSDYLLGLLAIEPSLRDYARDLDETYFDENGARLYSYLISTMEQIDETPEGLQDIDSYVKMALLLPESRSVPVNSKEDRTQEVTRLVRQLKENKKKDTSAFNELYAQLLVAREKGDQEEIAAIENHIKRLRA